MEWYILLHLQQNLWPLRFRSFQLIQMEMKQGNSSNKKREVLRGPRNNRNEICANSCSSWRRRSSGLRSLENHIIWRLLEIYRHSLASGGNALSISDMNYEANFQPLKATLKIHTLCDAHNSAVPSILCQDLFNPIAATCSHSSL